MSRKISEPPFLDPAQSEKCIDLSGIEPGTVFVQINGTIAQKTPWLNF